MSELRNKKGQTLEQYLMSHVKEDKNGCWVWFTVRPGHYATAEFCKYSRYAHIVSYEHFNGKIEEGKIVRHKCDNPRCINPAHLETGTKKDNRKDFMERNPKAKEICSALTNNGAKAVKRFWDSMSPEERKEFCNNRSKKQMEKYPDWSPRKGKIGIRGENHPCSKLKDEEVKEMKKMIESEMFTQKQIAQKFGVSGTFVSNVKNKKKRAFI